jgi:hypothetical protein
MTITTQGKVELLRMLMPKPVGTSDLAWRLKEVRLDYSAQSKKPQQINDTSLAATSKNVSENEAVLGTVTLRTVDFGNIASTLTKVQLVIERIDDGSPVTTQCFSNNKTPATSLSGSNVKKANYSLKIFGYS